MGANKKRAARAAEQHAGAFLGAKAAKGGDEVRRVLLLRHGESEANSTMMDKKQQQL